MPEANGPDLGQRSGTIRQGIVPPTLCLAANPQDHSDFGLPAEAAGRLWCPARGVFPAMIRVGIVTTSRGLFSVTLSACRLPAWKIGGTAPSMSGKTVT